MSLEQFLNVVACIAIMLFGVYAILRPDEAAQIVHLKPEDATGKAEVRISFGGLSLMLGAAPLLLNEAVAYQVVGIVFLGIFIIRVLTAAFDHLQTDTVFMVTGLFELLAGLVLLLR